MFGSCRMCFSPTDQWQDFCNECATREAPAAQPDAERRPDQRHQQTRERGKARVAPSLLGGDVPDRVDQAGEDDEGER